MTIAGHVSSQEPTAGERAEKYSSVALTVSTGPPPADVPRLVGRSLSDGQGRLSELGLRAETREVAANEPAGTVVRVRPKPGTSLPTGSAVTLDVARQASWRTIGTYTLTADGSTPPLEITGRKWRITYTLRITGCEFEDVVGCSGPTLTIDSDDAGYDDVDLTEGTHITYGPSETGSYRLTADSLLDDTRYTLKLLVEEYS